MKKFKKLFSALLAAATAFAMTASTAMSALPVLAQETSGLTKFQFEKEFKSENGNILPSSTFTFEISPYTVANSGATSTNYNLPLYTGDNSLWKSTTATITFEASDQASMTKTGEFEISDKVLSQGVYRYQLREVKNSAYENYITYDTSVYILDVMVNGQGKVEAFLNLGTTTSQVFTKSGVKFTNICTVDELRIEKKVSGSYAEKDKQFNFKITIPVGGDNHTLQEGATFGAVITRSDGNEETVSVPVSDTGYEFKLANGDFITIFKIPEGTIYTVAEDNYSDYTTTIVGTTVKSGRTIEVKVTGNEYNAGTLGTPIVDGGNTVVFTNTKDATAPTGIRTDTVPYIVIFIIAVVGIAAFLIKRKKTTSIFIAFILFFVMSSSTSQASEAGNTNSGYIDGLTFNAVFESADGGILPNETLTFTMTPDTSVTGTEKNSDQIIIKQGISLGAAATVNIDYDALSDYNQEGTFSFAGVEFKGPAIYRYIVEQTLTDKNTNPYVTYSGEKFTIDLQVDNEGHVISVLNVTQNGLSVKKEPVIFKNTSSSDELLIKKTVSGTLGNKSKQFEFELMIPVDGDVLKIKDEVPFTASFKRQDGTIEPAYIHVGSAYEFTLADSEELLIEGVPEGMIYSVTEKNADDYTTKITCTRKTSTTKKEVVLSNVQGSSKEYDASAGANDTAIIKGGNVVLFENTKEYKADTGIRFDSTPYIVLFMFVMICIVLLAFKKRKTFK